MALKKVMTEHAGAKNGDKCLSREEVKAASRKRRRRLDKARVAEQRKP